MVTAGCVATSIKTMKKIENANIPNMKHNENITFSLIQTSKAFKRHIHGMLTCAAHPLIVGPAGLDNDNNHTLRGCARGRQWAEQRGSAKINCWGCKFHSSHAD